MIPQDLEPITIPATVAHRKFGELVRRAFSGEHFIVEKDGLPVVAIISMTEYKQLIADQKLAKAGPGKRNG